MPVVRTVLILVASGAVAAASALFVANVHSSDSALRALDPPGESRAVKATLPEPRSGAAGWRWPSGVPGYRFGSEERFWNGFALAPQRRAEIEARAHGAGLPGGLRVLKAIAAAPSHDAIALVAAPARSSGVCLAFSGRGLPGGFTCMDAGSAAAASPAFLAVSVWNGRRHGRASHTLDVLGVARGDVGSVEFTAPGLGRWSVYRRSSEFAWGTFALGVDLPREWTGRLTIRRAHGKSLSVPLASRLTGRRLVDLAR
jgi:hypothetical protein